MLQRWKKQLCLLLAAALLCSFSAGAVSLTTEETHLLDTVVKYYDYYHLDGISGARLEAQVLQRMNDDPTLGLHDAVNNVIHEQDHFSYFLTAQAYQAAYNPPAYYGIGVQVGLQAGQIVVIKVMDGSGRKAGIQVGDAIISVNGQDVSDLSISEVGTLIKGDQGTPVTVGVVRKSQIEPIVFNLTREAVYEDSVQYEVLDGKYGYIRITDFDGGVASYLQFCDAVSYITQDQGLDNCIIDLRNNHGGALTLLLNMVNQLIADPNVLMVTQSTRYMGTSSAYSTGSGRTIPNLVLLVNENTASSAELFAGILQDLNLATVIGTTTYGKGRGQMHITLPSGDVLVITASEISLPTSGVYHGIGIIPDYVVRNTYAPPALGEISPLDTNAGDTGANFVAVKQRLAALGYLEYGSFSATDTVLMRNALKVFQSRNKLTPDGNLTPQTLLALDQAIMEKANTLVEVDNQLSYAKAIVSVLRSRKAS